MVRQKTTVDGVGLSCSLFFMRQREAGVTVVLLSILLFLSLCILPDARAASFNLAIDLPKTYAVVDPGQDIWFTVRLLNLDNQQRMDVTLVYEILDDEQNILVTQSTTVAIETQASFVASIPAPAASGTYTLRAYVAALEQDAVAQTSFVVATEATLGVIWVLLIGVGVLVLIIVLLVVFKNALRLFLLRLRVRRMVRKKLRGASGSLLAVSSVSSSGGLSGASRGESTPVRNVSSSTVRLQRKTVEKEAKKDNKEESEES